MNKFLLILVFLILVIVILPIFLPSTFFLSRSIEIKAPVAQVFSNLTNLNEYVKWNPFSEGDPTNQTNVTGDGVGSFLTWIGDKTGEGKMTITKIENNKKIDIKMDFYKPMSSEAMVSWILKTQSNSMTEMTWTFNQDLSYFKRYFGIIMPLFVGKPFNKGLLDFKNLVESAKEKIIRFNKQSGK